MHDRDHRDRITIGTDATTGSGQPVASRHHRDTVPAIFDDGGNFSSVAIAVRAYSMFAMPHGDQVLAANGAMCQIS